MKIQNAGESDNTQVNVTATEENKLFNWDKKSFDLSLFPVFKDKIKEDFSYFKKIGSYEFASGDTAINTPITISFYNSKGKVPYHGLSIIYSTDIQSKGFVLKKKLYGEKLIYTPIVTHLGDCLKIMPSLPDKSIDMILCDLPYETTACSWDNVIPFELLWKQYKRLIRDNGAIVLTGSQPFTSALIMSNIKWFKYEWIWEKQKASNFLRMKYQPGKYHENILVFSKGKHKYNPIMWKAEKKDNRKNINNPITNKDSHLGKIVRTRNKDTGFRYPKSIIKINKSINKNLHPTEKPVDLFRYLIKTYTNEGDTVLDNCMGSGTTLIACAIENRNCIGIEKEPKYYEIAINRYKEHVSQTVINF